MECNHICIIGLGSNTNKETSISHAHKLLSASFPDITYSSLMVTEPIIFKNNTAPFLNQIALFRTPHDVERVHSILKQIEHTVGRREGDKQQERIVIDLDLIQYDDTIIKPSDFLRDYVRSGMEEVMSTGCKVNGL